MNSRKKKILLYEGQIAREAYFILQGSIRFYYNVQGTEITGNIFTENMFSSSHDSFFLQAPSKYTLETIEAVKAISISHKALQKIIMRVPEVQTMISKVLVKRLTLAHQTISRLITLTPEERYQTVLQENPEWIQRIPHYIIASYIGISATSFSRIRKRTLK